MRQVRIVGIGMTSLGRHMKPADDLCHEALQRSLTDARLSLADLDGIVAVPSLSQPHFMQAHYFATKIGVFPHKNFVLRTLDTGGAGPISALFTAAMLIRNDYARVVAIVGGDAVLSLGSKEFLNRADGSVEGSMLPSPAIPHGYDKYAQWHLQKYGLSREQLAMVSVISSHLAVKHPEAMCKAPLTLDEVLKSRQIAPVTNLLECARRADGACCLILAASDWYGSLGQSRAGRNSSISSSSFSQNENSMPKPEKMCPVIVSTGEASGPLYPPPNPADISEDLFSCERAASIAYSSAQLGPSDIDFFALYDCFPICLIRALESCRVCKTGEAGMLVQEVYNRILKTGSVDTKLWPINTHGGLLGFGAPWEVPAMFNVVEAVAQLTGTAGERQLFPKPQRALVYGNGGIFSASSVAILGDGSYAEGRAAFPYSM